MKMKDSFASIHTTKHKKKIPNHDRNSRNMENYQAGTNPSKILSVLSFYIAVAFD